MPKIYSKEMNFFTHCVTIIGKFFWKIEFPTSSCPFSKENAVLKPMPKFVQQRSKELLLNVERWWRNTGFRKKFFSKQMLHWLCKLQLRQSCRNDFDKKWTTFWSRFENDDFFTKSYSASKFPLTVEEDSFVKPTEIFWQKDLDFSLVYWNRKKTFLKQNAFA